MILFSHPTGNANVRHAAEALAEARLLQEFWTCVGWDPEAAINRLLPRKVRAELARRALPAAVRPVAHFRPWREAGRMACARAGITSLSRHERGPFSIDAVFRDLDRHVARRVAKATGLTGVYAYEDGAAATFTAARERGIARIYDLPIGYWRAAHVIYAEEAAREPQWACTLSGMQDSTAKLARKDEELELADVVMVASSFTKKTIEEAPTCTAPIHVIPYGAPASADFPPDTRHGEKLRVFFAGSLGQRKGLSYLLDAVKMLGDRVELTLLGTKVSEDCAPLNEALKRHHWIPSLPHAEVLREMTRHDVFVFPSLFEGFGLVLLEAMAQGLPIITTPNTAGPDLIEDGREGFIVPIRSAQAIVEKLDLLCGDAQLLSAMKIAAHTGARRQSWAHYRSELSETVRRTATKTPT
ncbi:MAG: glycosyltransferase family 4 protein [Chthoniobacteraceae bacterium]